MVLGLENLAPLIPSGTLVMVARALVVVAVGFVIAKVLDKLIVRASADKLPIHILKPLRQLVLAVILGVSLLSALTALDIDVTGILVAGGVVGIVVGFASQTTVSNLISGLFLFFDRPFKIGDAVEVAGHAGVVTEIHILSTRIRRFDGTVVRIPNESVFGSEIVTLTSRVARRVEFVVGIAYKESIEEAREILMKVLREHPLVLEEPSPEVFADELADSSVNLKVRCWVPPRYYMDVRKELVQRCKEALDRAGIEIPFPQRVVWIARS